MQRGLNGWSDDQHSERNGLTAAAMRARARWSVVATAAPTAWNARIAIAPHAPQTAARKDALARSSGAVNGERIGL